tara:strand:- start:99 stop:575 length:477 start_codon:yes stop_codon:yes gene_type:complete
MVDFGDAYYPFDDNEFTRTVPAGRYVARVVGMNISENVKFGRYVADVFKPSYEIDAKEHPEYATCVVKDNGIFRYKKVDECLYEHKKNWGFAKFLSIMRLWNGGGKGGQLPYLYLADIDKAKVLIDVFMKKFVSDIDDEVIYPVARTIQLVEGAPVPF